MKIWNRITRNPFCWCASKKIMNIETPPEPLLPMKEIPVERKPLSQSDLESGNVGFSQIRQQCFSQNQATVFSQNQATVFSQNQATVFSQIWQRWFFLKSGNVFFLLKSGNGGFFSNQATVFFLKSGNGGFLEIWQRWDFQDLVFLPVSF